MSVVFSVSSTKKTDHHNITETLLKVVIAKYIWFVCLIVLNTTFNNISAISWRPVLVMEEAGENHRSPASNW
jgi:hypothetical protein